MIIAIDFDGTWTADPVLWSTFCKSAISRGHQVWCITARPPAMMGEVFETAGALLGTHRCLSAGNEPKASVFERHTGQRVDVWIDDAPELIKPLRQRPAGLILPG